MAVLTVENLSKNYGKIAALRNIDFSVPAGTVFGILGPNGSGKTTLLGIVMDVLRATSGNFRWNDLPANESKRKKIGTLLETPNFYHYLSGEANLEIAAAIKGHGKEDIHKVLQAVNLYDRRKSKFNTYSLGMKQRLAIASTLLGDPDILVFDEPTNGLDPAGIAEIRELIQQLNSEGKTIIMASHILDEVEKVCTHVAIIQKGVLKTVGSVSDVLSTSVANKIIMEVSSDDLNLLKSALEEINGIGEIKSGENELHITCDDTVSAAKINQYCFTKGIILSKLNVRRKSLETRFLEITGNQSDR
ncbi:MAG: ABC transporter ATP-binding protein [Ferruginibacter sp.]